MCVLFTSANIGQVKGQHSQSREANNRFYFLYSGAGISESKGIFEFHDSHQRLGTCSRATRQIGTMGLDAARAKQIAANKRLMHGAANWRGPIHKNKINFTLGW